MKLLFTSLFILGLLGSCQQSQNDSKTMSQDKPVTTSGSNYRVIALQPRKGGYDNDDYNLMIKDFEKQVNQAIAEGWKPLGGVATAGMPGLPVQAMIKEE